MNRDLLADVKRIKDRSRQLDRAYLEATYTVSFSIDCEGTTVDKSYPCDHTGRYIYVIASQILSSGGTFGVTEITGRQAEVDAIVGTVRSLIALMEEMKATG